MRGRRKKAGQSAFQGGKRGKGGNKAPPPLSSPPTASSSRPSSPVSLIASRSSTPSSRSPFPDGDSKASAIAQEADDGNRKGMSKKMKQKRKLENTKNHKHAENRGVDGQAEGADSSANCSAVASQKKAQYSPGLFVECPVSRLDFVNKQSDLASSEYRGIANLCVIITIYYMAANPLLRYYEEGVFFDRSLAIAMFYDIFFIMFMWFKLVIGSFSAVWLHCAFLRGWLGSRAVGRFQHFTQALVIGYAIGQILYNDWPIVPAGFVLVISMILMMKMHSYTKTNMEFHRLQGTAEAVEEYPANVTMRNFGHYLLCPVLVYEPKYPTGPGFRWKYFALKFISLIGAMTMVYMICTSFIIPNLIDSPRRSLVEIIARLIFPFLLLDLLFFYILFECICNLFAEVVNFGDREFYKDWWNSTSWDEFSRKWNRPVHLFLLRHVYLESHHKYSFSQRDATIATFLFSAVMHELFMAVCFRLVRLYMFGLMLLQIPLIALSQHLQKRTFLGNACFWAGLMFGVPLLAATYGREWAQNNYQNEELIPLRFF
eukprot:GHVT01029711.1.p1 GENE.GHVT01029711.1~~GHVT01029711.1.p1  ORF type:complete len:544 (-),score=62.97 GHVT01029711.1:733-2364(-)